MNIGNESFQILTPEQANPMVSSLQRVIHQHLQNMNTQARTQGIGLKNKMIQAKLPYIAPEEAEKLKGLNLTNAKASALLPYVAPQAAASLMQTQQGGLASALANEITKLTMPDTVQRAGLQNQQILANIHRLMTGAFGDGSRAGGQAGYAKSQLAQEVQRLHPGWNANKVSDAVSGYLSGNPVMPDGSILPAPNGTISGMSDLFNMHTNTAQGINQNRFGFTLDNMFKKADPIAQSAFTYAGAKGQAKLAGDKILSQTGNAPQSYYDYLAFTRQTIPGLASEILRTGGANSTDQQKLAAIAQLNPIAYDSTSDLAEKQWDYLKSMYKDVDKSISASPTAIKAANSGYASYGDNDYSDAPSSAPDTEDPRIAIAMKKYGLSRDDAIASLGG